LPAIAVPVVAAVSAPVPEVVEPFAPLLDGLLNEVLLPALAVSFLLPDEAANSLEPAVLEDPLVADAPLAVTPRLLAPLAEELAFNDPLAVSPAV
jgi:hypothetical protein